jgi:pimeloyl-ACP methyl ester carboxylesterase
MDAKTIRLHDGRILGYAEFGVPAKNVMFYFHGQPGSRLEAKFLDVEAVRAGIRLIGVDRPGMGLSSFKAGRSILDWPDDVIELADSLRIDRFAVTGFSGGGPYAIACAYKIPDRLSACGIIAGVGKTGAFLSFLSKWLPWILTPIARRFFFKNEEQAKRSLRWVARRWTEPDRKSLRHPGVGEIMAASLVEAFRQGSKGSAYDGMLLGSSWEFNLKDVRFPNLYLWHGELDQEIPIAQAKALCKKVAHCKPCYYPEEGHISLIVNRAKEIITTINAN